MNNRRAAALYRELADLDARRAELQREIATALVEETDFVVNDVAPKPPPRTKATPVPVRVPTDVHITDIDRAHASAALRRLGHRVR